MEGLLARHITIYSKPQVLLLMELVETLFLEPLFVSSDFFWSVDRENEYPPSDKGGDDWFTLGTTVEKKYWAALFNHTKLVEIGKIKWEFNNDTFRSIDLVINNRAMTFEERQNSDKVMGLLHQKFKCQVNCYHEEFTELIIFIKAAQTAAEA